MVPAGAATEQVVMDLARRLSPGDTLIDGGNSYFKDDVRGAGQESLLLGPRVDVRDRLEDRTASGFLAVKELRPDDRTEAAAVPDRSDLPRGRSRRVRRPRPRR